MLILSHLMGGMVVFVNGRDRCTKLSVVNSCFRLRNKLFRDRYRHERWIWINTCRCRRKYTDINNIFKDNIEELRKFCFTWCTGWIFGRFVAHGTYRGIYDPRGMLKIYSLPKISPNCKLIKHCPSCKAFACGETPGLFIKRGSSAWSPE